MRSAAIRVREQQALAAARPNFQSISRAEVQLQALADGPGSGPAKKMAATP
jgi:hypothetical protein